MAAMMLLGFSAILLFQSSSSLACDTSSCRTEFTELTCREIICSIFKPMPDVTTINIINRFRGVMDLRGTSVNRVNFQPDIFIERSPCKQVLISRPVLVNDHRCMEVDVTPISHQHGFSVSEATTHDESTPSSKLTSVRQESAPALSSEALSRPAGTASTTTTTAATDAPTPRPTAATTMMAKVVRTATTTAPHKWASTEAVYQETHEHDNNVGWMVVAMVFIGSTVCCICALVVIGCLLRHQRRNVMRSHLELILDGVTLLGIIVILLIYLRLSFCKSTNHQPQPLPTTPSSTRSPDSTTITISPTTIEYTPSPASTRPSDSPDSTLSPPKASPPQPSPPHEEDIALTDLQPVAARTRSKVATRLF